LTESAPAQTSTDSEKELAGDEEWAALPNSDAMEEVSLARTPLAPRLDQPAQVVECPEVHLAKAQFNQVPATTSAEQGLVANGRSGEPSSSSADAVDAAAIDVDQQLPILPVTIGIGTL
jgi:hypothetical protein